jgi:hypothetical protein
LRSGEEAVDDLAEGPRRFVGLERVDLCMGGRQPGEIVSDASEKSQRRGAVRGLDVFTGELREYEAVGVLTDFATGAKEHSGLVPIFETTG